MKWCCWVFMFLLSQGGSENLIKFWESREFWRVKNIEGIHLGPSSSEVSEGPLESLRAITLGHSKVNDTRRSTRNSSVIYQRVMGLPVGCCFRNSPLIRRRVLLLSSVSACKLYSTATIVHERSRYLTASATGTDLRV